MKFAIRALVLGMLITGFAADHMLANKAVATTGNTIMVEATALCRFLPVSLALLAV